MKNITTFFYTCLGFAIVLLLSFAGGAYFDVTPWVPFIGLTILAIVYETAVKPNLRVGAALDLVVGDTTYSGTYASYFLLPATFGLSTLRKGVVYVQDGIKKKHTVDTMDFTYPLQPRKATPTPTPASEFINGYRSLEPLDLMVYSEVNPRAWEQNFLAEQLSRTLLARELPVTAENYMMQIALRRAFEKIETGMWIGSLSYVGTPFNDPSGKGQLQYFDGYLKLMVSDADIWVPASPVALTAANIGAAMESLLTLIAQNKKALLDNPDRYSRLKFIVSINTEQIYQDFLTNQPYKNNDTTEKGINRYKGYDVVALGGMPDDTILFCEALMDVTSNLYVGMNSMEDNNLQLQRLQANSELFFFKGLMKYAVQYFFSDQIALYTTLTAADFV